MWNARKNTITRDQVLEMLSDEEITRLSLAEARAPIEGDEFVSLVYPDDGVLRVGTDKVWRPDQILPRSAVSEATWSKIVALVARANAGSAG